MADNFEKVVDVETPNPDEEEEEKVVIEELLDNDGLFDEDTIPL